MRCYEKRHNCHNSAIFFITFLYESELQRMVYNENTFTDWQENAKKCS
jgi:hypothetical protein